ncbi:MAG: alanine racemase [Syntrophales bacterium LBB04]|nr:alanine racemase [Syntrophales bacterium LBB04]
MFKPVEELHPFAWLPPFATLDRPVPNGWPHGFRTSWLEVNLQALEHNLSLLRSKLPPGGAIAAVIKDNAYGHGMVPVARFLEPKVEWLAVAILEEALILRDAGIRSPVLVLNGLWPGQEQDALRLQVVPAISSIEGLLLLEEAAHRLDCRGGYHLKVDTGMQRWGLAPDQLGAFLEGVGPRSRLHCEGLLTHLACADDPNTEFTSLQLHRFCSILDQLQQHGIKPRWLHVANSAGVLYHPGSHFNLVRPGIALYGYDPHGPSGKEGLRPVLTWKSQIALLRQAQKGSTVGYGASYLLPRDGTIAVIPVGYGDGLSRLFSNRGKVCIAGQAASIVGRISMDAITADVSDIREAAAGTEVILMGELAGIPLGADQLADQIGTISYEMLTSLSPRLGRLYFYPQK